MSISDKIVALRIATRRATMCESRSCNKSTLCLKTKILYLMQFRELAPNDIMSQLMIGKTNLASLAKQMLNQHLIDKVKYNKDKRGVFYVITDKGLEYLKERLTLIEEAVAKSLPILEEYDDAEGKLSEALNIFELII